MENKATKEQKPERLKRLSAQGMSLQELIRCVMSVDPKPLWEQEKREREEKAERKRNGETGKQEKAK